jgi:hypothetical protein
MRSSFPLFAERAAPLQDLLEVVYQKSKGRTRNKAASVSLEGKWTKTGRNLPAVAGKHTGTRDNSPLLTQSA